MFAGPGAALPDLMMAAIIAVMFAGFLRFDDAARISVRSDLLILHPTHMEVTLPKSKTDQEGRGSRVFIARVGGPACPVGLTERLLASGGYVTKPRYPEEDVGPLLCRVKKTQSGHELQQVTGSALSPVPSLSYTSFKEKLAAMCQAAGVPGNILPHSLRIGGNSAAAAQGVPEELRKVHGRWKTDAMVQHYTRREADSALAATRNLGLA